MPAHQASGHSTQSMALKQPPPLPRGPGPQRTWRPLRRSPRARRVPAPALRPLLVPGDAPRHPLLNPPDAGPARERGEGACEAELQRARRPDPGRDACGDPDGQPGQVLCARKGRRGRVPPHAHRGGVQGEDLGASPYVPSSSAFHPFISCLSGLGRTTHRGRFLSKRQAALSPMGGVRCLISAWGVRWARTMGLSRRERTCM